MLTINRNLFPTNPYHLVETSPWPILVSFSLLSLTIGAAMYMHGYPNGHFLLTLGFSLVVGGMLLWFRDIIVEGTYLGNHTVEVQKGLTIGVLVRRVKECYRESKILIYYYYIDTANHLVKQESCLMNLACGPKALAVINQILTIMMQAVVSMMKAVLLEVNLLVASTYGHFLVWNGKLSKSLALKVRANEIVIATQVVRNDHNVENLPSKETKPSSTTDRITLPTSGLPKSSKAQGNGSAIVPAMIQKASLYGKVNTLRMGSALVNNMSNKHYYSTVRATQTSNVSMRLDSLSKWSTKQQRGVIDRNLINLLCDPDFLFKGYEEIKSNPGNMSPGITPETLDGIDPNWFNHISEEIKSGKFQFQPSRRIQIPKPGSTDTRPLSIGSPRDKIIQNVMKMILEAIYEPVFSNNSHGFRPNRGCHSALKAFYINFKYSQWLIEGDISKCFDTIEHNRLMSLIEQKITDRRFTQLIQKSLNAGYFEFRTYQHNIIGTPQGSIISPILANIYLHQLDEFVETLIGKYNKGTKPRRNPTYRRIENQIARAKKNGNMKLALDLAKEYRTIDHTDFRDENFRRINYIRYADDWIVGIRGPSTLTKQILQEITEFCSSIGLTVSENKTKITNLNSDKALFLGTELSRSNTRKYTREIYSSSTKRLPLGLRLSAPLPRIIKKLTDTGFIKQEKSSPKFLWLHNTHDQIIHLYNSVFRGFLNYYSFAHNYSKVVSSLNNILRQSCAKLLATKFSLGNSSQAYKKFGRDLKSPNGIKFLNPSHNTSITNFKVKSQSENPIEIITNLYVTHKSLATLAGLECKACGSSYRVEMHHIRMMKDLNPKLNTIDKLMVKANRKQIPLCRSCHMKLHRK
uniref:Cytochrome c oxidase subunit 3 n=1 Tax=Sparassis crispa TaxID=139825 RepID=A0A6N0GSH1_9APHY|nr:Cox3 [Sparassis crispa]